MKKEALERVDYSLELIDNMTSEQRRSLGAVSYVIEANLDYVREVLLKDIKEEENE